MTESVFVWMSFCDPDRPAGSQFLGVVITEIPDCGNDDANMIAAVCKARALGINPGGEVSAVLFGADVADHVLPGDMDRLLSKAQLVAGGYISDGHIN